MSGFRNPIVAGLDLIRQAIRSPNYVPGVSGWTINKDGTAEFQDLTARGNIDADSITVPSGAVSGQGRLVIESDIPPELTNAVIGIVSALLFYVTDEASGLERGYFFIANSNENAEFTNPSLQFGQVQYPILGDPGSATVADVKANKTSIMMDNLIPLDRFFNIHISDIGGLTFQDGSFLGSIDGTFGTNNVNIALPTQDGVGGVFQMATDALFEIPADARVIINVDGATDRIYVRNDGDIQLESGGQIIAETGSDIIVQDGATVQVEGAAPLTVAGDQVTASQDGVNAAATTSGQNDTTSATYVNMAGTGSVTSFSFVKRYDATRIKITMWVTGFAITSNSGVEVGVLINGTDYKVTHGTFIVNERQGIFGIEYISGVNAGTYTVQGRWFRQSGTGTLRRDTNDWLTINAEEVN